MITSIILYCLIFIGQALVKDTKKCSESCISWSMKIVSVLEFMGYIVLIVLHGIIIKGMNKIDKTML